MKDSYEIRFADLKDHGSLKQCAAAVGQQCFAPGYYSMMENDLIVLCVERRGMIVGYVAIRECDRIDERYQRFYLSHMVRTHLCPVSAQDLLKELFGLLPEKFMLRASCCKGSSPIAMLGIEGIPSSVYRMEDRMDHSLPLINFDILIGEEDPPEEYRTKEEDKIWMDLYLEDPSLGLHYTADVF